VLNERSRIEPVRVGIAGLGYWGPNLARVFQEFQEADVRVLCDIDETRLDRVGRRFGSVRRTTSFKEMLADDEVEAVAIATPVGTHVALAAAALQAGKHVFVEKPLAHSSEAAAELIALADASGLTLMTGHTFLYSPPVNILRDLIAEGALGEIYFISSSRVNLGLHQPDVSVIWDLGPHDFSILHYWLNELPTTVSAIGRSCIVPGTPDVVFISLQYASGTVAHVELSWLAPSKLRRTAIVGSQKMAVYDDTSNEPVRVFDSGVDLPEPTTYGEYRLTYRAGEIVSPRVDPAEPLALELADFCSAVRGGTEPRASNAVALNVVQTIEAAERSLEAGGIPTEVRQVDWAPRA
jgi:predicted dehydrogenase